MRGELGEKQLDLLIAHRRRTGQFEPSRTGRPWPVMQSLARRGLIWIERRRVAHWHPLTAGWQDERDETCWFFGLTATGLSVVTQALKQKSDEAM